MKVLITHELFMPECHGGGEIVVYELARRLSETGIKVKVVTTGNPKIKFHENIETVRIPVNRYFMNFYSKFIEKEAKGFDIIQTNNYNAAYPSLNAAKKLGLPCVCMVHGAYGERWIDIRGKLLGEISAAVERFQIARDFDKFIFLSRYARDQAVGIGVEREKCAIVPPGIPRDFSSYKVRKKEQFILFVGRIAKQKGIKYLIESAERLPNIKFVLIGRSDDENLSLVKSVANIEYLGFVDDKKLLDLYSRAPIFCLPSIGETFGLVLLEAMASGCSIISTVPLDFEGRHISPKNSDEIVKAIEEMINNKKDTLSAGVKNRMHARNYSWERFTKNIIKVYEELI